ncbi:MAG: hypothetical protein JRJ42_03810 [Deltaproteobacteria bacterium]|nr:hypothetical protein [Deltaproteobacteria bacterium]MBW2020080.1 hypothetical protein [Deltaproteobacteria bacterium]MBW2074853.1 hypothetical protein [Deltaproteobacteria bacterium]
MVKVKEVVKEIDEFEKMLREFAREYLLHVSQQSKTKTSDESIVEELADLLYSDRPQGQLIRKYSSLRPIIEKYSQCFISTRTFKDNSTYPHETYKFVIQNRSIMDFKRLYDDLEWIKGSLERYDPETELDEHGNVLTEKEVSSEPEVVPPSDVKTMTNVYVRGNLIQGDVNLSVSHIYQTLERIIDEQIDDPQKKEATKGLLKKVYEEIKGVGTDIISKTLGEILRG